MGIFSNIFGGNNKSTEYIEKMRAETTKINEDVAQEIESCLIYIKSSSSNILARCIAIDPTDTNLSLNCLKAMNVLEEQAKTVLNQALTTRMQIASAGQEIDWEKLLQMLKQWRITAFQINPSIDATIRKINAILDQAGKL